MAFFNIHRSEQQEIILQLDQALYNHHQWHNALIRTLICQLPPDNHDIATDAHQECRFGQWYYNCSSEALRTHPGFVALGDVHQHMHQLAAGLLTASHISPPEYDLFANTLERMQLEVLTLKRELEDSLYNHDSLTGAISRVNMLPILREQQILIKRKNQACCIAMIDIDNFKTINDSYGHQIGDQILSDTLKHLFKNIRPYDKVFRYGGDEFLLCMQQTDLSQGFEVVERLRKDIQEHLISTEKKENIQITISIGLTALDPDGLVEQSIERADQAVYSAKATGRNCTRIWEPQSTDKQ